MRRLFLPAIAVLLLLAVAACAAAIYGVFVLDPRLVLGGFAAAVAFAGAATIVGGIYERRWP
jgi:hypothetical protein